MKLFSILFSVLCLLGVAACGEKPSTSDYQVDTKLNAADKADADRIGSTLVDSDLNDAFRDIRMKALVSVLWESTFEYNKNVDDAVNQSIQVAKLSEKEPLSKDERSKLYDQYQNLVKLRLSFATAPGDEISGYNNEDDTIKNLITSSLQFCVMGRAPLPYEPAFQENMPPGKQEAITQAYADSCSAKRSRFDEIQNVITGHEKNTKEFLALADEAAKKQEDLMPLKDDHSVAMLLALSLSQYDKKAEAVREYYETAFKPFDENVEKIKLAVYPILKKQKTDAK